ncbi:tyrosine-type recombinase/integrase [Anaerobaca lacustris]|uniref:Tyrosine-type recombinase/integrase n=1 Tax=Anaerobaca lacustris TaxID=3044600 RepID=A0AAW6TYI3_9BACT|nr:tyrosine-type recombinase/integrase [Sedimentisphaerales bacterium M17dextr]
MVTKKVSVSRKWLEPIPEEDGIKIPRSEWVKKRRHCWIVRWYSTAGKRHGKLFDKRKEAERYARKLQVLVDSGKQDEPSKITLGQFVEEHKKVMRGQVAHATLMDQLRALHLLQEFVGKDMLLQRITSRDAEAFIASRIEAGLKTGSVNKDIRTLKRVFNLAIEPRGYLRDGQNPFAKIRERKQTAKNIRYVTVPEYRALMEAAGSLWWKALLSTAYCCGLRRSEILNLTWADIDFDAQRVRVRPKESGIQTIRWEPKDHQHRVVPMSNETAQFLVDLQAEAPEAFPYIFIPPKRFHRIKERLESGRWNDRKAVINNLTRGFEVIRSKAGVSKCTPHDLRRSAITNWAQELPVQVVQEFAGHSNIATTRKYYLTVRAEDVERASQLMNRMLSASRALDTKPTQNGGAK